MNDLVKRADAAIDVLRDVKTSLIRMFGPDKSAPPTFILWRGERMVAFVHVAAPWDGDKVAAVAEFAVRGFRADCVSLSFESWMVDSSSKEDVITNPDTGEDWGPGEMGDFIEKHGRGGIVKDSLMVIVAAPGDRVEPRMVPFDPVQGSFGWNVKWSPAFEDQYGRPAEMAGHFMDALRFGLRSVPEFSAFARMKAEAANIPLAVADADLDAATAGSLSSAGVADVLLCAEADEQVRADRLSERTGKAPVSSADLARAASSQWN